MTTILKFFSHSNTSKISVQLFFLLYFSLNVSADVTAQSLRCNGDLAGIGDAKSTIIRKCGEPISKDSFCKASSEVGTYAAPSPPVYAHGGKSPIIINNNYCVMVEEWTYNPGYGQFMTMLQFENGVVARIRYGERVTR